tara:strand:+ start:137 stop:730 length:594 start_codon:yes stop_codon:yes gene_type:complete
MLQSKEKKLFFILSLFMGIIVISSNYLVQFPVKFFGLDNLLTYGAFSYPITFLITDLANRAFGKQKARYVVLIGFIVGIFLTLFVSTNFEDIISIRIAIGSALAFIIAQNLDVNIFDLLRKKIWYIAPMISSVVGSIIDTFIFFSIAFYGTGIPWLTLAFGDLAVKLIVTLIMLIPFRILINKISDFSDLKIKNFNY